VGADFGVNWLGSDEDVVLDGRALGDFLNGYVNVPLVTILSFIS
jgi:hypothetical protein